MEVLAITGDRERFYILTDLRNQLFLLNFLENGRTLEVAQRIAGHADSRITKLYDRRGQKVLIENAELASIATAGHQVLTEFTRDWPDLHMAPLPFALQLKNGISLTWSIFLKTFF